jgi:hypothetical protein
VPTNYDGTNLMTYMWVEAVLPEADVHYAEAVIEMFKEGVDEIGVVVSSGAARTLRPGESKPRNVMTFDGACQQVHSMFEDVNEALSDRDFEGYKFAAASTMVQQPNDVGHMHKALKKCFKGK